MQALARYEFKRKLEALREAQGRATELISLYVPPYKQISDVTSYLRNEYSQSANIKSKGTRKNVMAAIESISNRLKAFKRPPPNGFAFFVGHRAVNDKTEMVAHVIEPPEPIVTFLYRCDSQFHLAPLEAQLVEKERYGLVVIDRSEATLGLLNGKRIVPIKNVQSRVPSKHGRGGQSQRRFERLIEHAAHEYFKKIGDLVTETFLDADLAGILVGGPGATKDFFVEKGYLHHELKAKVLDTFNTGYTNEYGLQELVNTAASALSKIELMKEKALVDRFLRDVVKGERAIYGETEVRAALLAGAVDTLLLSEGLRKWRVELECEACSARIARTLADLTASMECEKCGNAMTLKRSTDIVQELSCLAEEHGTATKLISVDSSEGEMFLKAFGGIGVMMRFR